MKCLSLTSHAPGAAGFLWTRPGPDREGVAGGNLGLRDILAALQWVRHNIAAFGGDPSRVTVLGHDTGAALVNLLLISSAAKGKVEGSVHSALNGHQFRALAVLPLGRNSHKHSSKAAVLQCSSDWHSCFPIWRPWVRISFHRSALSVEVHSGFT